MLKEIVDALEGRQLQMELGIYVQTCYRRSQEDNGT